MSLLIETIGWLGAALVLGAYALLSMKKLQADHTAYHWMNIGGALCLAAYALWHNALASVAVNVIWLGIGLFALRSIGKRTNSKAII